MVQLAEKKDTKHKSTISINMSDKDGEDVDFAKPSRLSVNYKTPPNQSIAKFGESPNGYEHRPSSNGKYQEVQNLPTPITSNIVRVNNAVSTVLYSPTQKLHSFKEEEEEGDSHELVNSGNTSTPISRDSDTYSSILSTDFPNGKVQTSLPTLKIPKTRKVLYDSNEQQQNHKLPVKPQIRFTSEFRYNDPTSAQIDRNKLSNGNLKYTMNNYMNDNIRPVDRVASVPVGRPVIIPDSIPKPPFSEPSINYIESPVDWLTTYAIGTGVAQQWTIVKEIGHGSFSKVYLCTDFKTAIKVTDLRLISGPDDVKLRMENSLTRELDILKELNHPNIVHLLGSDIYSNPVGSVERVKMAINYAKGGDLYDLVLNNRQDMSVDLIGIIFSQIVNAIYYIHIEHQVCHRDIKLENILLLLTPEEMINGQGMKLGKEGKPILMLSDFGLSKKLENDNELLTTRCGSEDYVSPELLLGMKYDGKQNDCWSLGVVLYTILESRLPFDPLPFENNPNSRRSKPSHRIAMIAWHWYYMKGEDTNLEWGQPKEITKMLLTKRNRRASIETIINHPWVQQFSID